MRRQQPPGLAGIDPRGAIATFESKAIQRYSLAVEHSKQIVVRRQEQVGRVGKRVVQRKPRRIGMTVRADDRQGFDGLIEFAGDTPHMWLRRQQTILVQG